MTLTPEQWKEYQLPPSQWDNLTLRNALNDIQELAAQRDEALRAVDVYREMRSEAEDDLAVYREHWDAMMAYQYSRSDADMWKYEEKKKALMKAIGFDPYAVKMEAVRKMRETK